MTRAKPPHLAARRLLLDHLDMHPGETVSADLDPDEAGIVGSTRHVAGGDSYHLGKGQLRRTGHRYSVDESPRDRRGLDDYASALDIGWWRRQTPVGTVDLRDQSRWLVDLCEAGDPDTADIREVIWSPDGRTVRRWDRLRRRTTGDSSHTTHTHVSEHRDADGHRMLALATRWLQHIGLLAGEDDMTQDEFTRMLATALQDPGVAGQIRRLPWTHPVGDRQVLALLTAAEVRLGRIAAAVTSGTEQDDARRLAEELLPLLAGDQVEDLIRRGMTPEDRRALAARLAV